MVLGTNGLHTFKGVLGLLWVVVGSLVFLVRGMQVHLLGEDFLNMQASM